MRGDRLFKDKDIIFSPAGTAGREGRRILVGSEIRRQSFLSFLLSLRTLRTRERSERDERARDKVFELAPAAHPAPRATLRASALNFVEKWYILTTWDQFFRLRETT